MLNDLLLLSGNDIPFEKARVTIHQPTIKEIAYIGEESFYTGCEFLRFSKDRLSEEDRIHLEDKTNFEIIMLIMKEKNAVVQKNKLCVMMVLSLIFPLYDVNIKDNYISLIKDNEEYQINNNNYDDFLDILKEMFCLKENETDDYKPAGDLAKEIADKLRKRHQQLAELKNRGANSKVAILSRYVSIITTGQQKDINQVLQYTVYQLFDEFKRYMLKINFDIYLEAKMAGAKDLKEVDDWMIDIHP